MTTRSNSLCRLAVVLCAVLCAAGATAFAPAAWGTAALAAPAPAETTSAPSVLDIFVDASARYDVPRDMLVALGYAETHLDNHGGQPSAANGFGMMHLVRNATHHTLNEAVERTGFSADVLRTDDAANVAGAAAVLRWYADQMGLTAAQRRDVNAWHGVLARYGGAGSPQIARLYADTVYDLLRSGLVAETARGRLSIPARPVAPVRGSLETATDIGILSTDYGPAHWVAASSSNYTVSSRESTYPINYVVIHVTQGSYAGTISWFQNPSSQVSAHYVVRSSDGDITQMVREKDIAWHAGNWTYNTQSVGIEHEGFVDNPSWFTDAMYRASAALTRNVCDKYGIPKDRSHIIGHVEVPGATHTDPGPYWNWTYYMQLVTGSTSTWSTIVDNASTDRFTASANWGFSSYSSQRYGTNYRYATPVAASDVAWYKVNIPTTASYRVDVWYPSDPGYNDRAPYLVATPTGNQVVYVDQRSGGGTWRTIGTFTLAVGDGNKVGVSRWTGGSGLIIADAIRVTRA